MKELIEINKVLPDLISRANELYEKLIYDQRQWSPDDREHAYGRVFFKDWQEFVRENEAVLNRQGVYVWGFGNVVFYIGKTATTFRSRFRRYTSSSKGQYVVLEKCLKDPTYLNTLNISVNRRNAILWLREVIIESGGKIRYEDIWFKLLPLDRHLCHIVEPLLIENREKDEAQPNELLLNKDLRRT